MGLGLCLEEAQNPHLKAEGPPHRDTVCRTGAEPQVVEPPVDFGQGGRGLRGLEARCGEGERREARGDMGKLAAHLC